MEAPKTLVLENLVSIGRKKGIDTRLKHFLSDIQQSNAGDEYFDIWKNELKGPNGKMYIANTRIVREKNGEIIADDMRFLINYVPNNRHKKSIWLDISDNGQYGGNYSNGDYMTACEDIFDMYNGDNP